VTTIVFLAAGAVAATTLGLALMLCVAAARADRQMRNALLDALGWSPRDDWALAETQQGAVPHKEHAAS
jgi:hypothetical protein